MDIGSALTFMFNDRRWPAKLFIGGTILAGALLLSPALAGLGLIALPAGYMLNTLMNVRDRYYPHSLIYLALDNMIHKYRLLQKRLCQNR